MNTNHIDTLTEWWENAEQGTPREGDTYIARFPGRAGYDTGVVDSDGLPPGMLPNTRILARAPKPAWHDAVAVIATCTDSDGDYYTGIWVPEYDGDWVSDEGHVIDRADLRDVTPLIEAKVTDEMVERAAAAFTRARDDGHVKPFTAALYAALGLEAA